MNPQCLIVLMLLLSGTVACVSESEPEVPERPAIVEVFACSDNCPGPEEQYIKRIYEGVSDEDECRRLGGEPYTIFGWGQRTICEVP